ncbi:MAG: leucyl/phenylalanyl-tRNA--protein transferase [Gammaproteobacteria bacterium]
MGGTLAEETLVAAYRRGIFPWYSAGQPILWWSPDPRAILTPDDFHASRSLIRNLRRQPWRVTIDCEFAFVVQACAVPRRNQDDTWLTPAMQAAYLRLHRAGFAHSLECWLENELVGGIYGVAIGRIFFGESMFSRVDDGSKVALYALCRRLMRWGYRLLDCQIMSSHLERLGCSRLRREQFVAVVSANCALSVAQEAWAQSLMFEIP